MKYMQCKYIWKWGKLNKETRIIFWSLDPDLDPTSLLWKPWATTHSKALARFLSTTFYTWIYNAKRGVNRLKILKRKLETMDQWLSEVPMQTRPNFQRSQRATKIRDKWTLNYELLITQLPKRQMKMLRCFLALRTSPIGRSGPIPKK